MSSILTNILFFLHLTFVCRYSVGKARHPKCRRYIATFPSLIVTNNGPQFDSEVSINFFHELKIKNLYSTPRYPQSNSQAEASNKTFLTALKKRLHSAKGKWVDELPRVRWAYRTTSRKPTEVSLFALTYGMEAIIVMPRFLIRPEWLIQTESGARDYLLGLSLTGSFSELTPIPVFSFICTISVITKNFYIYNRTTTGVVSLKIYTHILSPIYLDMYIFFNTTYQRLRKQCGEHLSLSWPALLMWDVLSSILVFFFCTYMD